MTVRLKRGVIRLCDGDTERGPFCERGLAQSSLSPPLLPGFPKTCVSPKNVDAVGKSVFLSPARHLPARKYLPAAEIGILKSRIVPEARVLRAHFVAEGLRVCPGRCPP